KPVQLTDMHPFEQIDMSREGWIGFAGERSSNDFLDASFSRCVSEQSGIHAISGDDSQNL
ncbi:MAG: hypothetical protein DMF28_10390, partial [Verrucomicrobia bacterium]